jgi:hypothetical protein
LCSQIDLLFAKKEFKPLLEARMRENRDRAEKEARESGEEDGEGFGGESKTMGVEHQEESGRNV